MVLQTSALYQTAPWGKANQPDFLNQAVRLETELDPEELLGVILQIEAEIGRVRKEKWGARVIDIDILHFGDKVFQTQRLTIPHPLMHERRFSLLPLLEVDPGWIHPLLHKDVATLIMDCPDKGEVIRL